LRKYKSVRRCVHPVEEWERLWRTEEKEVATLQSQTSTHSGPMGEAIAYCCFEIVHSCTHHRWKAEC